jgi:hypothetical protein
MGVAHASPVVAGEARLHVNLAGEVGADWEEQARVALRHLTISNAIDIVPLNTSADPLSEMLALDAVPQWLNEILAESDDATIQAVLASGPRASPPSPTPRGVREISSASNARSLRLMAEDDDPQARAAAARNPTLPIDMLAWLADDESRIVRRAVAENPNASTAILERLAQDYSWSNQRVRLAIVRHSNIGITTLDRLAGDLSVEVRRAVLDHPALSAAAREQILASALVTCADLSEPLYRTIALAHPLTPADQLAAGAGSFEWIERFAIARNPAAPAEVLARLKNDGNRLVRAAAKAQQRQA